MDDENNLTNTVALVKLKKITIKPAHTTNKSSFCWKYFGDLILEIDGRKRSVMPEKVYCLACLTDHKEKDEDQVFGKCNIKSYSGKVSTGNLTRHLKEDHKLHENLNKTHGNINLFLAANSSKPGSSQTKTSSRTEADQSKKKWILARDLVLWTCKALLPFDFVSDDAMIDFFQKYKIIVKPEDLPSRTTLSRQGLDDVYEIFKAQICMNIKKSCSEQIAITSDIWTDSYRRLNYITVTLHFISDSMELTSFTLATRRIDGIKTGEKIKDHIEGILMEFGLETKKVILVTDAGSNMKRAALLAKLENHLCWGHGLHNLVVQDGINKSPEIFDLVLKSKKIVKCLRYKLPEMEKEAGEEQKRLLLKMEQVGEQIEMDTSDPVSNQETLGHEDSDATDCEDDDSAPSRIQGHVPSLKTATPTRWNSCLELLESLYHECNRAPVHNLLGKVGKPELRMTDSEWRLLAQVIRFLNLFKEATKILSASNTTTINLALLYRCEISSILKEANDEELLPITRLKNSMLLKLNHRMPLNKLVVTAALLDPRFQGLKEIDFYLETISETRVSFLANQMPNPKPTRDAVEKKQSTLDLFMKLSEKHSAQTTSPLNPKEVECWKYFGATEPSDLASGDLLKYWEERQKSFPSMSALARSVLCVPATSTPSERVFSVAGLILNAKRSRLHPNNVDKILFIHDNYNCLKSKN